MTLSRADVPGCNPEDVEVNLEDSRLTLTAPTGEPLGDRWEQVYGEYREGHFMREFRLGKSIDQNNITAKMNNGVLELTLPKAEKAKPKKIEVKTGETAGFCCGSQMNRYSLRTSRRCAAPQEHLVASLPAHRLRGARRF